MQTAIKVTNVVKTFKLSKKQQKADNTTSKVKLAVNGLSFEAKAGEIYGLLGSNGAGKTTTLRMISTLIKPDSGEIIVQDIDALKEPLEVRKIIGFLTSELKLEEFFTPDYLFNFYSELHQIPHNIRDLRKKDLFDRFEITSFSHVKVGELSSGMKQKASLAISLVHNPNIIIFDEPTNGLDVLTAKVVTDYLILLKEQGKTIILSTHIFSLVEKVCDSVGIIVNGKIVLEGKLPDIIKDQSLEDVFFNCYLENTEGRKWEIYGE